MIRACARGRFGAPLCLSDPAVDRVGVWTNAHSLGRRLWFTSSPRSASCVRFWPRGRCWPAPGSRCSFGLALRLIIDGIDGTFARMADVPAKLPRFSGERLDLVIDYVTYVFVPALALLQAGYLEQRRSGCCWRASSCCRRCSIFPTPRARPRTTASSAFRPSGTSSPSTFSLSRCRLGRQSPGSHLRGAHVRAHALGAPPAHADAVAGHAAAVGIMVRGRGRHALVRLSCWPGRESRVAAGRPPTASALCCCAAARGRGYSGLDPDVPGSLCA